MSANWLEVTAVDHEVRHRKVLYPVTVQGLYFAPACETPLPVTVPLCTSIGNPAAITTVQAHIYLGPPHFTTLSDDFDDSPSDSGNENELGDDDLPLPIVNLPSYLTCRTVSKITIGEELIALRNPFDLFYLDQRLRDDLIVNSALQATISSMWPGALCTFKGGLLVVMRSHTDVNMIVNLPRERFDLVAFVTAALLHKGSTTT